jgi:acyl-CoA synthetase (NDP forming)
MPVEEIVKCTKESDKIVIAILNAPETRPPPGRTILEEGGVPVFSSPERAARALASVLGTRQ